MWAYVDLRPFVISSEQTELAITFSAPIDRCTDSLTISGKLAISVATDLSVWNLKIEIILPRVSVRLTQSQEHGAKSLPNGTRILW